MRFTHAAVALAALAAPRLSQSQIGTTPSGDAPVVIHAGAVLDGRGGSVRNAYIVVRNGKIERLSLYRTAFAKVEDVPPIP